LHVQGFRRRNRPEPLGAGGQGQVPIQATAEELAGKPMGIETDRIGAAKYWGWSE